MATPQFTVFRNTDKQAVAIVADFQGDCPNHFDDVFKELERMEAILQSIPDLGVDEPDSDPFIDHPPDPELDI
ncbi:hypothetical protein [Ahrensia sp. R2A130]|uniref:hypothetical protein n=1 Tax=Ahrensia sp. R2A130 TaxID=744979 RepID=UPI0001E0C300|nr:hypothetical protein [Ahrensia sp. R2A130]EFL90209.1 hypothetical protein R2A130_0279 [Ahrensia sp. R2A130]